MIETAVGGVMSHQIDKVWSAVTPWLMSVPQEDFTLEDMRLMFETCRAQLWIVQNVDHEVKEVEIIGVFATEILIFPQKKIVRIIWAGGREINTWIGAASNLVSQWALRQGCHGLELQGRPGWERLLAKYLPGSVKTSIVLRKEF